MKKIFPLITLTGFGALLATTCSNADTEKAQPANGGTTEGSKPNVLLIVMDDMCDWVKYLGGNNQAQTPNLDKLATQSAWFANAYAAVPLSNPSRAALMSGLQPWTTGIYNNEQQLQDSPALESCVMMPEHFRKNGYMTLWSGKIFHNKPSEAALQRMWDDRECYDGGYGPWIKNSTVPTDIYVDKWRDFQPWTGPDTDFPDVVNSKKVIDFLGQKHDKPFFVAMGFYRPHNPYTAPKRFFDQYNINTIQRPEILENDLDDIPPYAINNFIGAKQRENQAKWAAKDNYWEQLIRAYLACTSFSDDNVGKVLAALAGSTYADNTIVIVVGDNGFHIGQKERYGKAALWRQSCHVPFLVSWPKSVKVAPGEVYAPVSLIDIYPTLVSLCGLPSVPSLAGNDLSTLLANPNASWNKPCFSTMNPGNMTVHKGEWNYLRYANGTAEELYNIDADKNEFYNKLYSASDKTAHATIKAEMAAYLPATWHAGVPERTIDDEPTRIVYARK